MVETRCTEQSAAQSVCAGVRKCPVITFPGTLSYQTCGTVQPRRSRSARTGRGRRANIEGDSRRVSPSALTQAFCALSVPHARERRASGSPSRPDGCSFPTFMLPFLLLLVTGDTTGYWQQQVAYRITASLDEPAGVLTGLARISYVNRSPDT